MTDMVIYPKKHKNVAKIAFIIFLFILNVSSNFTTSINAIGKKISKNTSISRICGKWIRLKNKNELLILINNIK